MTRALTLGLLLIATAANSADIALATRHDELRAPSRASSSRKVQWAPSGNFSALHTRAVFRGETERGTRPYAGERSETAAGAGIFLSRDSAPGDLTSPMSLQRYLYAHGNPLRYTDPTGRCIFQSCKEMWDETTAPEPPAEPPPTTPVVVAPPQKPETEFDWEASQDKKMRERFDYYLYEQEPPASGDAADILAWRQQRANARGAINAMETVNDVSHWYLREVAAPYLIAEGGGLAASKVGGAVVKAVARDLAVETKAVKQLARVEKLEKFMAEQEARNLAAAKRAEFGGQEAYASANRATVDSSYRGAASQEARWNVEEAQRVVGGQEGRVGTFDELNDLRVRGDNLTPHHVPSDAYMSQVGPADYTRGEGISIWLEQTPVGGRHRRTLSYGRSPDLSVSPRDALAREAWDVRQRFREDGLYTPANRSAIQDLIEQNKERWGPFFEKK